MKSDAAVADTVRVAALVTGVMIAEQQRAGCERRGAHLRPVLECAGGHCRDGHAGMAFFEYAVARPVIADNVVHAPAVAASQQMRRNAHAPF